MLTILIMFFKREKKAEFCSAFIRKSLASPSSVRHATTSQPGNHH